MIPEQNLVEFPTFANNGTKVKPEAEKYDGGYVPADVLPAQHANWLFNKTSAAITELNAAVESVSEEIRNIVEAGGATPSESDNLQALTAIRYLISEAETRAKALGNATGTLAIAHGGTGATTAAAAQVNLFPDENTTDLTENDFLVTGAANSNGEFSDTKHLFRTKLSKIWNYIKNKIAGITDSEPTAGSLNLVTSGSIKAKLDEKVNPPTAVTQSQYDSMTPAQRAGKYWIITDAVGSDQPMIRDDVKSTTSVWSSTKTDNTINNALADKQINSNPDKFVETFFGSHNFNDFLKTGFYRVNEINNYSNAPAGASSYGQLIVSHNQDTIYQQYSSWGGESGNIYVRCFNIGGSGYEWIQLAKKRDLSNYIKTKTFVANNSVVLKFETDNFLFFNIIGSQNARNAIDSFAFLNVATGNFSFINRGLSLSGNWNAETKELTITGLGEWAYCQVYGKGLIFD